ncbi:MAG: translation initiation factor IF-2 associated domain-containing protein, partial [Gammaproteobacteria bacterium]|nr:translation initiation factor IF-2 associated domain-containing protein [Gammaproteobacteria bacterium]
MAEVTVSQFAGVVGISVDRLVQQLSEAGLPAKAPEDMISDDEKSQLLSYLRRLHGKNEEANEPAKITLKRKTVSELKVPAERGRLRARGVKPAAPAKTVSVEVRKKRTYIKRSVVAEEEAARVEKESAERDRERAEEEALREAEETRIAEQRAREEAAAAEEEARRQAEEAAAEAARREAEERARAEQEAVREVTSEPQLEVAAAAAAPRPTPAPAPAP